MGCIVVTGAGGFLGRAVRRVLEARGQECIAVDWRAAQAPWERALAEAMRRAGPGAVCLHLAGMADASACRQDPGAAFAANVTLAWTVLAAMEQAGATRIVLPSTAYVYGEHADVDLDESMPLAPRSVYAHTKATAEALVANWARATGGQAVRARLSNLYGPGMTDRTVLGRLASQLRNRAPVSLRDLSPVRDFLWLDDAATALADLCTVALDPGQTLTVNVSTGKGASVGDAVRLGLELTGRSLEAPETPPGPPSSRLVLDNAALAAATGFVPSTELRQGLRALLHSE